MKNELKALRERVSPLQRYRNVMLKARLKSRLAMREFLAGQRDWLPCSGDTERAEIIAEFARLSLGPVQVED